MAYVEVLKTGLTIGGKVRREGEVVSAPDFEPQSKSDQVKRWGEPRYKQISQAEFAERGGRDDEPAVTFDIPPAEEPTKVIEKTSASADEFADFEGLNVQATLDRVASFDDAKTARFVQWEKGRENPRKTVLGPLGA